MIKHKHTNRNALAYLRRLNVCLFSQLAASYDVMRARTRKERNTGSYCISHVMNERLSGELITESNHRATWS